MGLLRTHREGMLNYNITFLCRAYLFAPPPVVTKDLLPQFQFIKTCVMHDGMRPTSHLTRSANRSLVCAEEALDEHQSEAMRLYTSVKRRKLPS